MIRKHFKLDRWSLGALAAAVILILFASAASASASVLIGDQGVAPSADNNSAGLAQAFVYTATATGTTGDAQVYVDTGTTATTLLVGVYADSGGKPGGLIASGQLASPQAAAWNDVPLSAASLTSGTHYWIALLGTGGQINYRDTFVGGTASYVNTVHGLTSLPATYSPGNFYNVSPASVYVNAVPPPGPVNPPVITGTPAVGQVLTSSTGTWTNNPTSFAYQWQRCSTSCSNITGATASTYTVATADVGDTIDAVVTATNAGGSASQTSAQTATATACTSTYSGGSLQTWVSSLSSGQTGCYSGTFTSGITLSTPNVTLDGTSGAAFNGAFQAITVTASNDTIKGGTFTSSTNGIETSGNGETGLTVDGVTMTGITTMGIQCTNCTDSLIENSSITDDGVAAIEVESSTTGAQGFDKNVVTNTSITSQVVPGATGGPDGIEAYNGLTVSHDHFTAVVLQNGLSQQHPDQIQLQGNWAKIYDNTFTNVGDSDVDLDAFANANVHDIYVYNNTFDINTIIDPYPDFVRLYHSSGSIATVNNFVIANNVFADSTGSGIPSVNLCYYEDCATATGTGNRLTNNEFVNLGNSNSDSVFARGPWTSDHNVFDGGGGHVHWLTDDKTTSLTFSQFISSVDSTSVNALPAFRSYTLPSTAGAPGQSSDDFHLAAADTVSANTGASLSSIFTSDLDGVSRPQGSAWDRGPFERIGG